MKNADTFLIRIENQDWISKECRYQDLCSHGEIYLNVNGTIITQSGMDEQWGISESALALLRTIDQDYISVPKYEEGLILHGCGTILMTNCPISIRWWVRHVGDHVVLSDFLKVETTDPSTGSVYYPDLEVQINKNEYKAQIRAFAQEAKMFFDTFGEKQISDDYDKQMYEEFWDEYNQLLEAHDD